MHDQWKLLYDTRLHVISFPSWTFFSFAINNKSLNELYLVTVSKSTTTLNFIWLCQIRIKFVCMCDHCSFGSVLNFHMCKSYRQSLRFVIFLIIFWMKVSNKIDRFFSCFLLSMIIDYCFHWDLLGFLFYDDALIFIFFLFFVTKKTTRTKN